jgi:zinc and cadmium transporter
VTTLGYILVFSTIGSVISLVGSLLLLFTTKKAVRLSHLLAAFAAGALLGATFFDLLPEALHESEPQAVLGWMLAGILVFFVLERFIHWFHHHELHHHDHTEKHRATVPLVMLGDTVHNFIDGVVIASTFLVDIRLGMITTLAVAAHEIPQEIGDFGIMLNAGIKRRKILLYNFLSALATILGALIAYRVGETVESVVPLFLAVTAGFFVYISLSDLIPGIHSESKEKLAVKESVLLFAGLACVWLLSSFLGH